MEACEENCSDVLWDYTGFCLKIDRRRPGGSSYKAIAVILVKDKDDLLSGYIPVSTSSHYREVEVVRTGRFWYVLQ